MAHLDEYKLLSDRRHAFRKRHSCENHLTTVINDWVKILDNGGQVDTLVLDFEKAFDTPPHELLKSKLFGCGVTGRFAHFPVRPESFRPESFRPRVVSPSIT